MIDVHFRSYLAVFFLEFGVLQMKIGAWGSVVVKALRNWRKGPGVDSRWCHWGFFSVAPSDGTMCPGVDSAPENEYQGFLLE